MFYNDVHGLYGCVCSIWMQTVCMDDAGFFNETSRGCLNSGLGNWRDTRPCLSPTLLQRADTGRGQRSGH